MGRFVRSVGPEPLGRPVERAEECTRGDHRISRTKRPRANAFGDEGAHAAFVSIALGDDEAAPSARQGIHLEMRRAAFDFVEQGQDVRFGERAQPFAGRAPGAPDCAEGGQQLVERAVLAEEEQLVLPAEIVIEIAGREVGGHGDLSHAGRGEAALAEDARGRAQDLDAARVGAT